MASEPVFDVISKSVVRIIIKPWDDDDKKVGRCGTIMECDPNSAFVIVDEYKLPESIEDGNIIVKFPDGTVVKPSAKYCYVVDGMLGILCIPAIGKIFDVNLVKGIEVCHQPLEMSERVFVYEGFCRRLIPGNVTGFYDGCFSHNCGVACLAEYGAPVVNRAGEFVGMSCSHEYHLNATVVSALTDIIERIKDVLFSVV